MGKKIKNFCNTETEKRKFYRYKNQIFLEHMDIDGTLIFKKTLLEKKIINTLLVTYMVIIK